MAEAEYDAPSDSDVGELCQQMGSLASGSTCRASAPHGTIAAAAGPATIAAAAGPASGPKKAKVAGLLKVPAASSRPKTPVSCATPTPVDSSALETNWVRFTLEKDEELKKANRQCGPLYYCLAGPSSVVVRQVSVATASAALGRR
jgi:hypothetical protein